MIQTNSRFPQVNGEDHLIGGTVVTTELPASATLKVPEAARIARVGQAAIRAGIKAGRIPHIKFGRNILIPRVAFNDWLNTCAGTFRQSGEAA